MNMKEHILAALKEQFDQWEGLLAGMSDDQVTGLHTLADWSTKDVIAHLWAWQQISVARVEAALEDREPNFPKWFTDLNPGWGENADQTNAWVYKTYHQQPWSAIYQNWKEGFLRFLELGDRVPQITLLDSGRFSWLHGYALAFIFIASYDHHQEHLDKLLAWLQQRQG